MKGELNLDSRPWVRLNLVGLVIPTLEKLAR